MKIEKGVTVDNVNKNLLKVDYAVRGPIVHRAVEIERELEKVLTYFSFLLYFYTSF